MSPAVGQSLGVFAEGLKSIREAFLEEAAKLTGRMGGFGKEERGFSRHWIGDQVRGDGVGDRNPQRDMSTSVILSAPLAMSKM